MESNLKQTTRRQNELGSASEVLSEGRREQDSKVGIPVEVSEESFCTVHFVT